jgi:hypothetical protein
MHDKVTTNAETGYRQAREAQDMAERIWRLMVDLDLGQKGAVLDRLDELFGMEESTHQPSQ